jgi:Rrf2 family protein
MQVSTKGRYALQFLLDLSQRRHSGPVALKSVAQRQGISKKYLEHIVAMLAPAGMLQIARGYQGGYRLAREPSEITVADVLNITEGGLASVPEPWDTGADRPPEELMTRRVWEGLDRVVGDYLKGITLQDIVDSYTPAIEYYI